MRYQTDRIKSKYWYKNYRKIVLRVGKKVEESHHQLEHGNLWNGENSIHISFYEIQHYRPPFEHQTIVNIKSAQMFRICNQLPALKIEIEIPNWRCENVVAYLMASSLWLKQTNEQKTTLFSQFNSHPTSDSKKNFLFSVIFTTFCRPYTFNSLFLVFFKKETTIY